MDYRRSYRSAAVAYADLVARLPTERWDEPAALGEWTLRDLVGHTVGSALRQVPEVLAKPATELQVATPEGYFAYGRGVPADVLRIAVAASSEDAHATGAALGDDPATMVGELAGRATQALAEAGDDDIVTTPVGGMRVRDWLPTRTFELVVHGLDAAAAGGVPHGLSLEAIAEATTMASRLAIALGDGEALLRALTGRAELPPKFTVLTS
ncbi:maleylpyruvate isomerase N-terminal domain-containing protein [Actinoplanes sp. KI2]|uniref:maleylpyruvate isomerase N-terminal domain-containing protein n=1 Tax=Actinoplanes sp. KI2 TaxID=2983315 RepID=UPI0021D5C973|nr:maleylpyruvate isomerase N-terminal domain-containing protein [Actinoplanes sp. KI2]MCU7722608.1 maleylpyruvate isomerase N-terminal domain-containing protein [Actinoplanes sp. KI2]